MSGPHRQTDSFIKSLRHHNPDNWAAYLLLLRFPLSEIVGKHLGAEEASTTFIRILRDHSEPRHWEWLGQALKKRDTGTLSGFDREAVDIALKFIVGTLKHLQLSEQQLFFKAIFKKLTIYPHRDTEETLFRYFKTTRDGQFSDALISSSSPTYSSGYNSEDEPTAKLKAKSKSPTPLLLCHSSGKRPPKTGTTPGQDS